MYKINEEKMFYDMTDGQAVIINFTSGVYYGSGTLGSAVIDRLVAGNAPAAIVSAIRKLPGCPADIDKKMDAFVSALLEKEILAPGDTVPGGDEEFPEGVAADGFDLEVNEYADMQDLILADPVHEVEEEAGWPVLKKDE